MIFNLFKSKPTLKELIPKGFVDIHSHILPEIGLFQANLLSFTNHYGKRVNDRLNKLISKNLIDFVGSDIHNTNHRIIF